MATLAPTVHERLARCGTRIYVDGLVAGADVVLSVGGSEFSHTATSGSHHFTVPPLVANVAVKAKQDAGAGYSPWSPEVVVEDALVPPQAAPVLPEEVGACSHCVWVTHLVPGCRVKLRLGTEIVGEGLANRHGNACVGVDLKKLKGRRNGPLRGRMYVCDVEGPQSTAPIVTEPVLPKPVVGSPLYGCQRIVPLSNLHRGAKVRLETNTGTGLGSLCSCWTAVNVRVGTELVVPEQVHAQAYWEGNPCAATSSWSDWQPVIPPDEGIKPKVLEALIEGDQIIRVENQKLGASLVIKIRPSEDEPAEEFGPRPASEEQEIALNAPLAAGNVVSVVQTLCGISFESDPVTVLPQPPVVLAPVIVPPLYACGAAVQVSNLHPGAFVRVYSDGIPIGVRWAGEESSISVPAAPVLVSGGMVTAKQSVGGKESPESTPPVPVFQIRSVQAPRIMRPVALGDTRVWVSRVTPGARVTIWSGGEIIGEADAAEPVVRVPVSAIEEAVQAKAKLCGKTNSGASVEPIKSPCASGAFPAAAEKFVSYGKWMVPAAGDSAGFETRIEGQLYFPASGGGKRFHPDARNLPLVIIAHGYFSTPPPPNEIETYSGYNYLARHLARWGMLVFSLNMADANAAEGNGVVTAAEADRSRAEIILKAVDEVLADANLEGKVNGDRIGLIGHSRGGFGVVMTQFLNESEGRGYAVRGVVSIAPYGSDPELTLRGTKYMQLLGSMDYIITGESGRIGFATYSHAWRPKTHFWIYGARHNAFNRRWVENGDPFEGGGADLALPPQDHERIAKCLINAFFQDALLDASDYAGYMEGTILPHSLQGFEIHTQHSRGPSRFVLDNYGDEDEEVALAAAPLSKTKNSQDKTVSATGSGLDVWQDIEFETLHTKDTKTVELSWTGPDVLYESPAGGIARSLTDVVALRIGQVTDATLNPVDQSLDLFVTLSDGSEEATVRLGAVAQVPYPVSLKPMKSVRLPLDAFKAVNPGLALSNIQSVTLWTAARATGHMVGDDLEFSP